MTAPDALTKEDEYRSREHDHLVEPMFAGLGLDGVEAQEQELAEETGAPDDPGAEPPRRGNLFTRMLVRLGLR